MHCKLCGLPNPGSPLREAGHEFCCHGCREVYRCFGDAVIAKDPPVTTVATPPQGHEAFLWVEGMHCASCEYLIERLAPRTPGILAATSSYASGTVKITYDPALIGEAQLAAAIGRAGYRARLHDEAAPEYDERPELLRLLTAGCLASAVMMLTLLFVYPVHGGFAQPEDYAAIGWLAFKATPLALFAFTTVLVFYVGWPILRGAWTALRVGVPNMDLLLALSFLAAYFYSTVQLFRDPLDLYFEVAGTLVAVVTIGRFLERGARRKATQELTGILRAWSDRACVLRAGRYLVCGLEELLPGDRVFVRAGETIPVDGQIVAGQGAIDESLMTGEAFPASRGAGERAMGGSILLEGNLEIEVGERVESRMANLSRLLWNMQSASGGLQGRVDRLARGFVPAVILLAALVGIGLLVAGASPERALLAALATLIVSCPCTFGLAIPLTAATAVGTALRRGIIVSSGDLFEKSPRIDIVVLDKTGTLSSGAMAVFDVIGSPDTAARAAAVERHSTHPVAKAIAALDATRTASEVELHPGRGAVASVGGRRIAVGSRNLFATLGWEIPTAIEARVADQRGGDSVVSWVGWDGRAEGAIVTRDRARPEWIDVVATLRQHCRVVLLTGAEHSNGYAEHVDEVHAGVPPEAKAAVIRRLKTEGRVAMIGDGSNDAPALAEADFGIAFGAPTQLAAEAADMVIPGDRLERVLDAFALVGAAQRRVRQNLVWALSYNAIAIPLAMTGLLSPLGAAVAMSASSLLVVANSTRALLPEAKVGAGDTATGQVAAVAHKARAPLTPP
ncbi:MAG: cation-translocating P-type ATPase [Rhodocyclales bacterium]|nr:cation-translocating P-type ATPase [Rhodocyclales bacterium]